MGPLTAMKCPSSEPMGAAQVDLVVCHHPHEFKDLLPSGDEAGAQHVIDAEGLARRGARRGGVVHNVRELLLQLQIVQNEAVAVVGYAEAVRGLAVGGSSEVGADPGGQPGAQRPRSFDKKLSAILILQTASLASLCRCRDSPRSTSKSLSAPATLLRLST